MPHLQTAIKASPGCAPRGTLAPETAEAVGASLRPLVASGKLTLRLGPISATSVEIPRHSTLAALSPCLVDGTGPTAQAKLVVSILQAAAQKGLNAEEYDASRWQSREEAFAGKPTPDEIARFNLALHVPCCGYIRR